MTATMLCDGGEPRGGEGVSGSWTPTYVVIKVFIDNWRWQGVPFYLGAGRLLARRCTEVSNFEAGALTLDEYLDRTVFHHPRVFDPESFKKFMRGRSRAHTEAIDFVDRLARSGRYFMAALHNESRDLNWYRIEWFGPRRLFAVFFSSCFLRDEPARMGVEPGAARARLSAVQE